VVTSKIRLEDRECPLSATMGIVGEWWTMLILHDCFDGYSRFDEFQANIGLSSSMLTSRLKTLVERGILERLPYQDRPVRYEYRLTDLGRSLRSVVIALAAWRNAQLSPEERSMILVDARTGREVEPTVTDAETGDRVDGPDFVFAAGPAAGPAMRQRYASAGTEPH
jgi:DNA-binding HxlR family transcriptional regulator